MKICFYSAYHIGDIFFSQPFVLDICRKNPSVHFYYWLICGHIFYENMCDNLTYLEDINKLQYKRNLINGETPEDISNSDEYLKQIMIQNSGKKIIVFDYNGEKYIGINTWCVALNSHKAEMELYGLIDGFNSSLKILKDDFNIDLNNIVIDSDTDKTKFMPIIPSCQVALYDRWINEYKPKKKIFIYNYVCRSASDPINFNSLAIELSKRYRDIVFILPVYYPYFEGIPNIKTCDKDFGCINDIQCYNLIQIEKISTSCDIILSVFSGSAWIFFNKNINENSKKYMNSGHSALMNKWYKNCYNTDKDIIHFFDLNNILSIIDNRFQSI